MKRLDISVVGVALLLCLVLLAVTFGGGAMETGSWGLSFQSQGQIPAGPVSSAELEKFDAHYLGNTDEKVIYLTFDAGYENGYTEQILDVLKDHQVPACFFLVGNYLEQNADLVRRMVEEGHIVGNHTMTHPDMSKIEDLDGFSRELTDLEALYREITGQEMMKFYRPPQGVYSRENLEMARDMGYQTVFWSLAYADWDTNDQPTREEAMEKLTTRIHNGAIVLLHSTSKTNAEVLDELLTRWEDMGYRFAGLDELK